MFEVNISPICVIHILKTIILLYQTELSLFPKIHYHSCYSQKTAEPSNENMPLFQLSAIFTYNTSNFKIYFCMVLKLSFCSVIDVRHDFPEMHCFLKK